MTLSELSFQSVQNAMASAYTRANPQPKAILPQAPATENAILPSHKGTLLSIRA